MQPGKLSRVKEQCPSEPKLFQAVSSGTEVPSDGVRQAEALWTVALTTLPPSNADAING